MCYSATQLPSICPCVVSLLAPHVCIDVCPGSCHHTCPLLHWAGFSSTKSGFQEMNLQSMQDALRICLVCFHLNVILNLTCNSQSDLIDCYNDLVAGLPEQYCMCFEGAAKNHVQLKQCPCLHKYLMCHCSLCLMTTSICHGTHFQFLLWAKSLRQSFHLHHWR